MWLLIHAGIKVEPCQYKELQGIGEFLHPA